MLLTDWIRAAVSGTTADGRKISKKEIQDMAQSYNPDVYAAKIWLEHLRGVMPDNVFKSLGDVVAVKSEEIKGGELAGRVALYVKLAPSDEMVRLVRSKQKTHLSVEIHPEFPTTNSAYLMGVGVTDSPASVGTGIMSFSTGQRKENLFSTPVLCDLSKEVGADEAGSELEEVRALLVKLTKQKSKKINKNKFVKASKFKRLQREFKQLKESYDTFMNEEEPQPMPPEHGTADSKKDIWKY